MKVASERWPS
jgi:predicted Zn-dependent peptidase